MWTGPTPSRAPSPPVGPRSSRSSSRRTERCSPPPPSMGTSRCGASPPMHRSESGAGPVPPNLVCNGLRFDPSGRFVAVIYDDGHAVIHGLDDPPGADGLRLDPVGNRMNSVGFHPSGDWLVTASLTRIAVWPFDRSRHPFVLRGHSGHGGGDRLRSERRLPGLPRDRRHGAPLAASPRTRSRAAGCSSIGAIRFRRWWGAWTCRPMARWWSPVAERPRSGSFPWTEALNVLWPVPTSGC